MKKVAQVTEPNKPQKSQAIVNQQNTSSRVPDAISCSHKSIVERSASENNKELITLSITDLLKPLPIFSSKKNNFEISLEINNLCELEQFQKSLPNQLDTNFLIDLFGQSTTKTPIFDKIRKINLEKINIDNRNVNLVERLLSTISANLTIFSNFTNLIIGQIGFNFKMPLGLNNLKSLTIGTILDKVCFILPNDLNNLLELSFDTIWPEIIFPIGLSNLSILNIEYLGANLKLSNLDNLSTLTIKEIRKKSVLEILNPLPKLKILTIERIWSEHTLGHGLDNLEKLIVKFIGADVVLQNLYNLRTLFIEDIKPGTTLTLSGLHCIRTLTLGIVRENVTIQFSNALNNLSEIIIEEICNNAIVKFPSSLNSLKKLTLKRIGKNVFFQFPKSLNNLQNIIINELGGNILNANPKQSVDPLFDEMILKHTPGTAIELPEALPSLKNFVVEKIAPGSSIPRLFALKGMKEVQNGLILSSILILGKKFVQICAESADDTFRTFTNRSTTFFQSRVAKIMPSDEILKQKAMDAFHNKGNTMKWSIVGICLGYLIAGWFGITVGAIIGATYGILTTKKVHCETVL